MSDSDSDNELLLPEQQADEDWEEWDGDEEEDDATKSLFSDTVLPNPEAAFEYDGTHYGFDIRQYKIERQLGDYDVIKVINFIRREVAAGRDPLPALVAPTATDSSSSSSAKPWSGEEFLNPALPDDPLITYDYDEEQQQQQQQFAALSIASSSSRPAGASSSSTATAVAGGGSSSSDAAAAAAVAQLTTQLAAVSAENQELKLRVAALMDAALPKDVREELRAAAAADQGADVAAAAGGGATTSSSSSGASSSAAAAAPQQSSFTAAAGGGAMAAAAAVDAQYFDSYSSFDIHHEMLSDKPRTESYRAALSRNPRLLSGCTVLDVGCGTSILSMFAATGGAAAVVGLDGSTRIAGFARAIVSSNRLDAASGGPISIIAGKVEDTQNIGHDQVDVIVSEWMGYALLFESMLDSVLAARDKWLKPGGAVLPDVANIYVAGASRHCLGTDFWKDVYGFNMQPIADELVSAASREAQVLVRPVDASSLSTPAVQVHSMDLVTMAAEQQDFTALFELSATSAQIVSAGTAGASTADVPASSTGAEGSSTEVAALVLWFDTEFSERFCKECPVLLSTSPHEPVTHWAQAVLPLAQPVQLTADGGSSKLSCRLSMARSRAKHRSLDISLEYSCGAVKATRIYNMEVSSKQ